MKMVKSLLLGSAAGLVAIAGAQAADLPVKAKPVEYVRICSAYGAGFYYIPGTDICLRVGGYTLIETGYNARAGVPIVYNYNNPALIDNRDVNRTNFRARGTIILDARAQTAIGTVRTYIALGADYNNNLNGAGPGGNVTAYLERAFTQFAGFTVGQTASFFDFGSWYSTFALSSVAWNWQPVFAYTANFGNGVSGTISIEDAQATRIKWYNNPGFTGTTTAGNAYGGQEIPDIVLNLRVDQAWGSAQVSGALHQLRVNQAFADLGVGDRYGWAVLGGIEIKTPMIAPGDSITLQGVYSRGAVEYTGISASPLAVTQGVGLRNNAGIGPVFDIADAYSLFAGPLFVSTGLTEAWSANLFFRHFWQPNLRSGFWLGYNRVNPPAETQAYAAPLPTHLTVWQAGSNIIWSPVPTLDLSLDVLWSRVETGTCVGNAQNGITCGVANDIWAVWTRWRRNF